MKTLSSWAQGKKRREAHSLSLSLSPSIWPEHSVRKATWIYNISHGSLQVRNPHPISDSHTSTKKNSVRTQGVHFPPFPSLIKQKWAPKNKSQSKYLDLICDKNYFVCVSLRMSCNWLKQLRKKDWWSCLGFWQDWIWLNTSNVKQEAERIGSVPALPDTIVL